MTNELTPEQLTHVSNALYAGNKIEAIKLYRTATGKDLKDSKDAVEKLAAELEAGNPAMFAKRRRQRFDGNAGILGGAGRGRRLSCNQVRLIKTGARPRQAGCNRFPDSSGLS